MSPHRRGLWLPDPLKRPEQSGALRRSFGSPVLFGVVQSFVAASLYFALGIAADHALGWTWLAFAVAAGFFVLGAISYVEAASLHQERGGVTVFARHAFNELWSFVAGWAVLLDYLIITAICALVATSYLGELWGALDDGAPRLLLAGAIVVAIALLNVRGVTLRRFERVALLMLADVALQLILIVLGVALLFNMDVLTDAAYPAGTTPSLTDVLFAFTLAAAAFSGLDASAGLAGEVPIGRRGLRRLLTARTLIAALPYVGIALVATSVLPVGGVSEREAHAPLIGVAAAFEQAWLRETLQVALALSGTLVLVAACNGGMLGLARLGHSLATNRQIPSRLGLLHARHATPVVLIAIGTVVALGLIAPLDVEFLVGTYAFGAMIAFTFVHLSVIRLRYREPERDRPFRAPFNVRIGSASVSLVSLAGALMSVLAVVSVLISHSGARYGGVAWIAFGLVLYVGYRLGTGKSLTERVTVGERVLTRTGPAGTYGRILVPLFGSALDDDIVQTAGRLAAAEQGDAGGSAIDALWVHEVPLALALDADLPAAERERAQRALERARAVGEEYAGVHVSTHVRPARRTGEAIVATAREQRSQAIVLAAESLSRTRGGVLLGGRGEGRDFLGAATRYVVEKAPCRVIFTAPPADDDPRSTS